MKKVKYVLYGIVALIVVLLISAIFLPKEYTLQVERDIDASKSVVFNLLSNFENRSQWDPIAHQSNVILDANNEIFAWSVGSSSVGKLKVQSAEKGSTIILEEYIETKEKVNLIHYSLTEVIANGSTKAIVDYKGSASWPMNFFNMITKRNQGNKLVDELEHLEVIAKERQVDRIYNGYKIVEDIVKERNFITRRGEIATSSLQQFYVQNLGALFAKVQDAELQMDGMPSGLFYTKNMRSNSIDIAAGIPVTEEVNILGAESQHIKTRTAIVVDYYGDYNNTIKAHTAINAYMADYFYVADTPIIEEYITDPLEEKDPNKWLTKITYYIEGK